jgi:hypothetical protein
MLRKLFSFPSPKELNLSDHNCLSLRDFSHDDRPTWEDYYDIIKEKYPVKYFILETIPRFFRKNIFNKLNRIHYYIVSHTIRRYHILDLRQPKHKSMIDNYSYGYCDAPEKMLYAIFNILNDFADHELKNYYCPPEDEVAADESLNEQRKTFFEIVTIHHWWNFERKIEADRCKSMNDRWFYALKNKDPKAKEYFKEMEDTERAFEEKTDKMIARLFKIRRNLWT